MNKGSSPAKYTLQRHVCLCAITIMLKGFLTQSVNGYRQYKTEKAYKKDLQSRQGHRSAKAWTPQTKLSCSVIPGFWSRNTKLQESSADSTVCHH